MPRYAALLRGVSPVNASMAELKAAFEAAGFQDVKTIISSGNLVFSAARASEAALAQRAERAMAQRLGRSFFTIIRPVAALELLLAGDPYHRFRPGPAKRIVTFLRGRPPRGLTLPVELHGVRILAVKGGEVFSVYLPTPKGPVFMSLIEKHFGKDQTTRTWDTVGKVVRAAKAP